MEQQCEAFNFSPTHRDDDDDDVGQPHTGNHAGKKPYPVPHEPETQCPVTTGALGMHAPTMAFRRANVPSSCK